MSTDVTPDFFQPSDLLAPLDLIREVARLTHGLDPEMPIDWMIKRTQFFAYELQMIVDSAWPESEKLTTLNRFFFNEKHFKCLTELSNLSRPSDAFRLSRVLATRTGSPIVLALMYAFLAERIDIKLEFVDFNPTWFLKWSDDGRSRYIDMSRAGATLSCDDLIGSLQARYEVVPGGSCEGLLESVTFERFLAEYLIDLKSAMTGYDAKPDKLLFLQNALMDVQSSDAKRVQLLPERAALHRKLGNFKSALADLKRYFSFHDRERCSADLGRLHDELVALIERKPPPPQPPV